MANLHLVEPLFWNIVATIVIVGIKWLYSRIIHTRHEKRLNVHDQRISTLEQQVMGERG